VRVGIDDAMQIIYEQELKEVKWLGIE